MLQIDMTKLKEIYAENTFSLLQDFIGKLQNRGEQLAYHNAFAEFYDMTETDLLLAGPDILNSYLDKLYSKAGDKTASKSKCIKHHKIISAFLNFVSSKSSEGDFRTPFGFRNYLLYQQPPQVLYEEIRRSHTISRGEFDTLIGELKSRSDKTLLVVCALAFFNYMRIGEIASIMFDKIYKTDDGCFIEINRDRIIRVDESVVPFLDDYVASTSGRFLFTKKEKESAWMRKMQYQLHNACVKCGINAYTLNDLRNSNAAYAHMSGQSSADISNAMGYRSERHIKKLSSLSFDLPEAVGFSNIKLV